jgi:hypothetical protein
MRKELVFDEHVMKHVLKPKEAASEFFRSFVGFQIEKDAYSVFGSYVLEDGKRPMLDRIFRPPHLPKVR